jgi:hypothetical protein
MAAAKLSDEAFSAILEAHPGLRERFASIAIAVANSGEISRRPTRSKSGLSRKCGCWGERRWMGRDPGESDRERNSSTTFDASPR